MFKHDQGAEVWFTQLKIASNKAVIYIRGTHCQHYIRTGMSLCNYMG